MSISGYVRRIRKKKLLSIQYQIKKALCVSLVLVVYMVYINDKSTKNMVNMNMPRIQRVYKSYYDDSEDTVSDEQTYERQEDSDDYLSGNSEKDVPKEIVRPIILVWQAMEYQMKLYKQHLEYIQPDECGGCVVTTNRSLQAESSALIHFNSRLLSYEMDVPDPHLRNPNQVYIFWSRETPGKTYSFRSALKDPRYDGIFNLTMNFRRDADIVDYFGNTEYELRISHTKQKGRWIKNVFDHKTGLVIWAVSNCNATSGARGRMEYAQSLINAGLNISLFGDCFKHRFTSPLVFEKYKFYLAFENSIHCPDYISEKFWRNGLRSASVPIVWGPIKADVEAIAPPNSFIHTDDFKNPQELVNYINYLDQNMTAYMEYHAWRKTEINSTISDKDIQPNHRSTFCRLCKRISHKPLQHSTVPSVYKWLYETRYVDQFCFKE